MKQQWEGIIEEVGQDSFIAHLKDLTNPKMPDEIWDIWMRSVPWSERELVYEGAAFYVTVENGGVEFLFRRPVLWTAEMVDALKDRARQMAATLRI